MAYLTGGAASRTPLLGPQTSSLQPYTRTTIHAPRTTGGVAPAARTALQEALAYYAPEGGYGKGVEAALERSRTKAVASGGQSLVSAGLAGTTMMAGLGKKFEEEVGMPTRARVEETRAGALSNLKMLEAQMIQGATEADRSRALQQYLTELQRVQSPSLQRTSRPTLMDAVTPSITPKDTGGYGSSYGGAGESYLADTGFSPVAAGGGFGLPSGEERTTFAPLHPYDPQFDIRKSGSTLDNRGLGRVADLYRSSETR